MAIILSAHKDTVKRDFKFVSDRGAHRGLLDNMVGIIACYAALYGNASLMKLFERGDLKIFHSDHEEFGIMDLAKAHKDDFVIVVDICAGERYGGLDFAIDRFWPYSEIREDVIHGMKWEGFNFSVDDPDETGEDANDESDTWKEAGANVISFVIPIEAPDHNWHGENASITGEQLARSVRALTRFIFYVYTYAVQKQKTAAILPRGGEARGDSREDRARVRPGIEGKKAPREISDEEKSLIGLEHGPYCICGKCRI